ncbi:MAG: DNA helicase [Burkholderiaceae bacterium]
MKMNAPLNAPLNAPIYQLKRTAKALARRDSIPLLAALDQVARAEGFTSWSLLVSKHAARTPAAKLLAKLLPGELVLLGARPGQGKTLLGLELIARTIRAGGEGWFFTLEWSLRDTVEHLHILGERSIISSSRFVFDDADEISADYIVGRASQVSERSLILIDYLQLLDQKRDHPPLDEQVRKLKVFARRSGAVVVLLSQIDRSFDVTSSRLPDLSDVRLPNPLELSLFDASCFVNRGAIHSYLGDAHGGV